MENNESWEKVLRSILGEEGAERALEAMRAAGLDPAAMGQAAGLPTDSAQLSAMLAQLNTMLAGDGRINWDLARDMARQQVHSGGDPAVTAAEAARIRQALQIADFWLDPVTDLTGPTPTRSAHSRAAWVEETLPAFQEMATPVAEHIVEAMAGLLAGQQDSLGFPLDASQDPILQAFAEANPSATGSLGGFSAPDLIRRLGSAAFAMQLGGAVAHLAKEAFGLSDIGVPLGKEGTAALISRNVDEFADGFDIPADEVLQFLAIREAAYARLYSAAPWLRGHVFTIVRSYAAEIAIDVEAMERAFREIDPSDPEQLRAAMSSGIFALEVTETQREALENLETTLAVIEGWVEHVTTEAALGQIPSVVALTETMHRRRAAGGPAEDTFKSLVGLELRPRRLRDAAALWSGLLRAQGIEGRDHLWSHPDLLPSSDELDNPGLMLEGRSSASEFDDALEALLSGGLDGIGGGDDTGSDDTSPDGSGSGPAPDSGSGDDAPDSDGRA